MRDRLLASPQDTDHWANALHHAPTIHGVVVGRSLRMHPLLRSPGWGMSAPGSGGQPAGGPVFFGTPELSCRRRQTDG